MILCHITALAKNHVIGKDNQLPWNIPEDLAFFKSKTMNKILIMGRKTFESIGRPLPKRFHIVITRNKDFKYDHPQVVVVYSLQEALNMAEAKALPDEEVFITGGGEIYKESLSMTQRLYLTLIQSNYDGDAYYPEWKNQNFKLTHEEKREGYSFCTFEKK